MAGFYVENFGCRATQADGAAIEQQLCEYGLHPVPAPAFANVVVLNTCTVTAAADQDARAAIRRIHRENPACRIVVTGCYAQRAPAEVAALPGVTRVVGNSHKHLLAEIALPGCGTDFTADSAAPGVGASSVGHPANFVSLSTLEREQQSSHHESQIFVSDIFAHTELLAAPVFDAPNQRTRPNLKVQDGCDNRCSFCVIPYVRGQSRSMSLQRVAGEVTALVASGYREVVISGINLGRWGRDLPKPVAPSGGRPSYRFTDLIRAILERTSLQKLRISSVEPMDWSDELISLIAGSSRIARHAHVPMQSGSDRVLRAMHRKYRPWHYREKIEKIHDALPAAAIGAERHGGLSRRN